MGFISSRDFIILLVFVNSCDCYGEWRECAKKVTRREDLIYRIINEYRARHEDTSPLHCMLKEKYKEEVKEDLDQGSYPESKRRSECNQVHHDHTIYYKSPTWDGDLEGEIVRMFHQYYHEIHFMYSGHYKGKMAFSCDNKGRYSSIVWRNTKEVICDYRLFPEEKWMSIECKFYPEKPFFMDFFNGRMMTDAEFMEGHGLPKDRSGNFGERSYWKNYNYKVVLEKYLKEVEDAKKKGSGYWDELIEVKEDEEEKILRKEENERWVKEKETAREKYERRGSRREEDLKRNEEGNDNYPNYEERKRKEKEEKERDRKEREKNDRKEKEAEEEDKEKRKEEEDKERRKEEEEKEKREEDEEEERKRREEEEDKERRKEEEEKERKEEEREEEEKEKREEEEEKERKEEEWEREKEENKRRVEEEDEEKRKEEEEKERKEEEDNKRKEEEKEKEEDNERREDNNEKYDNERKEERDDDDEGETDDDDKEEEQHDKDEKDRESHDEREKQGRRSGTKSVGSGRVPTEDIIILSVLDVILGVFMFLKYRKHR